MDETTSGFLIAILPRLPILVVYLLGVILAIVHASTLRGAAICAGLGFGCLALASLIGIGSQYWMMSVVGDLPAASIGSMLAVTGLLSSGASFVGMVLLVVAIFMRRTPPAA